jgi:hypothetical protein
MFGLSLQSFFALGPLMLAVSVPVSGFVILKLIGSVTPITKERIWPVWAGITWALMIIQSLGFYYGTVGFNFCASAAELGTHIFAS